MTDFFAQWQTLIGAAVGAFGAFTVAVFAYWLTRLSHRKDAAHVVYLELQMYKIAVSAYLDEVREIQDDIDHGRAAESDVSKYVEAVEKLRSVRPFLSPRLDAAMGTLYSSDLVLGVQLEGFRAAVAAAERAFASLEQVEARLLDGRSPGYGKDDLLKLIRTAGGLANSAAIQAQRAGEIIGATYIERWAAVRRLVRWLRRRTLVARYREILLARGENRPREATQPSRPLPR